MQRNWLTYFANLFGWTATGSTVVASAWSHALATVPDASSLTTKDGPSVAPLIFERQNLNEGERYAGHSSHASHASHASHSSHYSGSGGGDYTPYESPSYSAPTTPVEPRATDNLVMVMRVQTLLHYLGFYAGPIDGALGPPTRDAIGKFQAQRRLPVTSSLDDATLAALGINY